MIFLPATVGIKVWQANVLESQGFYPADPVLFSPRVSGWGNPDTRTWLKRISDNPLHVSLPEGDVETEAIVRHFAPSWLTDGGNPSDFPGSFEVRNGRVEFVSGQPSVYTYFSHAIINELPHLQINYVIWFSERRRIGAFDLTYGRLDGITMRITLGLDGRPIIVDAMNNCGCFHMFFPVRQRVVAVRKPPGVERAFVPHWLDLDDEGTRLVLYFQPGSHRVISIFPANERSENLKGATPVHYVFQPYAMLEEMKQDEGPSLSLFDSRGIVPRTGRPEWLPFFGFGISDVGSMRQRGHHATAFIGRRHFDDADLLARFFTFANE